MARLYFLLMLHAGIVLFVAYVMFSVAVAQSGYVVCYPTGRIFTPENCAVYSGPDIKIQDDI